MDKSRLKASKIAQIKKDMACTWVENIREKITEGQYRKGNRQCRQNKACQGIKRQVCTVK